MVRILVACEAACVWEERSEASRARRFPPLHVFPGRGCRQAIMRYAKLGRHRDSRAAHGMGARPPSFPRSRELQKRPSSTCGVCAVDRGVSDLDGGGGGGGGVCRLGVCDVRSKKFHPRQTWEDVVVVVVVADVPSAEVDSRQDGVLAVLASVS